MQLIKVKVELVGVKLMTSSSQCHYNIGWVDFIAISFAGSNANLLVTHGRNCVTKTQKALLNMVATFPLQSIVMCLLISLSTNQRTSH